MHVNKYALTLNEDVFQFQNITGFGIKRISKPAIFPFKVILFFFLIGLVLLLSENTLGGWGALLAFVMQCINWLHQSRKLWSLFIYLPSSENQAILSEDWDGLTVITYTLCKLMESKDDEASYVININQKHADIVDKKTWEGREGQYAKK